MLENNLQMLKKILLKLGISTNKHVRSKQSTENHFSKSGI